MNLGGVIITDGNERATLAVTRSLGSRGIPVFVGAEATTSLAGSSRFCRSQFVYPSPWHDPDAYICSLLEAARRWGATVIFPMTDIAMEIIGEHRKTIEQSAVLPIPSLEQYHRLSDKYDLTAWAQRKGIPVPNTIFIPDGKIDDAIRQVDVWPVVVKPSRSLLKIDGMWRKSSVQIAGDLDDLRRLYHEQWYLQQPSMVQQFVTGNGEGVFGLFEGGNPAALFAHRRLRERPPSGGVSVLREAIALPEPMTEYALRIMKDTKWDGIAMVEFKIDERDRIPYLMEINGRFWGSLQLAVDAGVDFPYLLYCKALAPTQCVEQQGYKVGIRSQWWLGDLDHLLTRLRNPLGESSLPARTPSRLQTFFDLINLFDHQTESEVARVRDIVPGVFEMKVFLISFGRAIGRKLSYRLRRFLTQTTYAVADLRLRLGSHLEDLNSRLPKNATKILVLCKGNICRSPFAEIFLKEQARDHQLKLDISSAGLDAENGITAYPIALDVSKVFGLSLDDHRTTAISQALVDEADIILVMEPYQEKILERRFPGSRKKTFLLGHFSLEQPVTEIVDPYGKNAGEFEQCYIILKDACEGFLSRFSKVNYNYDKHSL